MVCMQGVEGFFETAQRDRGRAREHRAKGSPA